VIITDPPRAGMHDDVLRVMLAAEPKRIVYVSCNPATQARDLGLLDTKYKVTTRTAGGHVPAYPSRGERGVAGKEGI